MKRMIWLHFKLIYTPIIPHILQLQCSNLPHKNCNNLPQGGIFTKNTCQSKTHAHKVVIIPSIYILQVYFIFLLCQFPVVVGYFWRKVNFWKCTKFTRRRKNQFFGHNFFLLPYMISKYRMHSWFEMFFIRYNRELLLSSSSWKMQL